MASFLQPIADVEPVRAGQCVLVLWRSHIDPNMPNIGDYWLGVVCVASMLPRKVAEAKPSIPAFLSRPVWLIGRSEFLWAPRSTIYHLTEAQVAKYNETDLGPEFATYFTLAQENQNSLDYWRDAILEHKKKAEQQDLNLLSSKEKRRFGGTSNVELFSDGDGSNDMEEDSHLEDSDYEAPVRKKAKRTTGKSASEERPEHGDDLYAPSLPPYMREDLVTSEVFTPPATVSASPAGPVDCPPRIIKAEPNDEEDQLPVKDLVEIFVGPSNSKFRCSRENLFQSDILASFIAPSSGTNQHPFIMQPSFCDIDPAYFGAMVDFLEAKEYPPLLIKDCDGKFYLDESYRPIGYDDELVRSAHLLNLAKRFGLPIFAGLIFRKVVHGHRKYATGPFLTFASVVMKYTDTDFADGDKIKGEVENWIINFLAENLQEIAFGSLKDGKQFWELMKVKGVELKVMEKRVEICKAFPGGWIKIED